MQKSAASLRLSLTKAGVDVTKVQSQVVIDLDVSGSFETEHRRGDTTDLVKRFVPWGLVFDMNGEIDVFTFSNGEENAHHVGVVDEKSCDSYVQNNIIGKVPGWNGGTDYSYVLEKNLELFGWIGDEEDGGKPKGFLWSIFGAIFGSDSDKPAAAGIPGRKETGDMDPSLVVFITDGDNGDKDRTRQVLRESQERGDKVFFQFVGYSTDSAHSFSFLQELADTYGNVGLTIVRNLKAFVSQSDDSLNNVMLSDKLVAWLKKE